MIELERSKLAAATLLGRRTACTQGPRLEPELRPMSIEDALAIQAQMIAQREDPIVGWKCLLPPKEEEVVVAPIFVNGTQSNAKCRLFPDKELARVEPEIAFVLGCDLPAQQEDFTEDQINDSIASAHMALELMQNRWEEGAEISFYEKLADGLVNQGIFIGPEIDKQNAMAANQVAIEISQGGNTRRFEGKHPNAGAAKPVHWLINYMSKRGTDFKAGQAVITGSFCGIVELQFGLLTTFKYQNLGEYQVNFEVFT